MKKPVLVVLVILSLAVALPAQDLGRRWEFRLLGGCVFSALDGTSGHHYSFSSPLIAMISESTAISLGNKNSFSLGGDLGYYFTPNFGLRLGVTFNRPKADITSAYAFSWFAPFFSEADSQTGAWPASEARLTSVPLTLNLVARSQTDRLAVFVEAGPAIFFNSFKADSSALWVNYFHYGEYIDFFQIPVTVPETSWTQVGLNVGAGIEFELSPLLALVLEGRYYWCPKKDFAWEWAAGTYDGQPYFFSGGKFAGEGFGGSLPQFYDSLTSPLTVDPSFHSLLAGIKLHF